MVKPAAHRVSCGRNGSVNVLAGVAAKYPVWPVIKGPHHTLRGYWRGRVRCQSRIPLLSPSLISVEQCGIELVPDFTLNAER